MKKWSLLLILILIMIPLASCGPKDVIDDEVALHVAETQTKMAWEAEVESAQQTAEAEPSPEPETGEAEESQEPAEAQEPAVTPEPEIVHVVLPDQPAEKNNSWVTDFNSIDHAEDGFTYGDQFFINRYERPWTRGMEEYRGYLDIIRANLKFNPPWFYVQIFLAEPLPDSSEALYGVELDLDIDGRGDYLILAPQPIGEEWTVEGVTVLEDTNEDVGGEVPVLTEELPEGYVSDGYDQVIFQGGLGEDPDLAWVRLNPEEPNSLEIAFKADLTGGTGYLWVIWADEGLRDPAMADYDDRFTFEEAGSPYPEHRFHPIQEIYLLDTTCRSWYGFDPIGDEIGLCQIYEPGEGFQLCYTFRIGPTSSTICNEVCMPECPEGVVYPYSCQPCILPE